MSNGENANEFDFTSDGDNSSSEKQGSVELGNVYDSRPQEDTARRNIAYLLIWLLWLVIGGILVLIAFGTIELSEIKEFAVILGPIVTLVSAATGFYYGTKTNA